MYAQIIEGELIDGEVIQVMPDSVITDSISRINEENLRLLESPVDTTGISIMTDTISGETVIVRRQFVPNSTRATWLAIIFPGGGQIYNRKYWKLPIVYGGFAGCAYALNWNNGMYSDYSQAYRDIMDNDPTTESFKDILPESYWSNETRAKETLRRQRDMHRRNRDLSIFAFIGVYLLSVIDAYVDAELSNFDISRDLGLKIEPSVINDKRTGVTYGLQCSIKF